MQSYALERKIGAPAKRGPRRIEIRRGSTGAGKLIWRQEQGQRQALLGFYLAVRVLQIKIPGDQPGIFYFFSCKKKIFANNELRTFRFGPFLNCLSERVKSLRKCLCYLLNFKVPNHKRLCQFIDDFLLNYVAARQTNDAKNNFISHGRMDRFQKTRKN